MYSLSDMSIRHAVNASASAIAAAANRDNTCISCAGIGRLYKRAEYGPRRYASGDVDGDEAFLRYEGVTGNTSITLQLKSGAAAASMQRADAVTIINDLHRGKNAGKAWKLVIDIVAALFLVLSLIGYILFFSLRQTQTLALTGISLAALFGIFFLFVP